MLIFALWIHVKRLTKVEIVVPRGLAIGCFLALLVLSLVYPAISHPQADLTKAPMVLNLDWFYLAGFPLLDYWTPLTTWFLMIGLTLLLMIVPWLPPKRIPAAATVQLSHCNGCGQCFDDCPFDAISMQARTDGSPRWKREAVVVSDLCIGCGICVGSCPYSNPFRRSEAQLTTGVDMPEYPVHEVRMATDKALASLTGPVKMLVFSCSHGVEVSEINDPGVGSIRLVCTGMLPPAFVEYALKKGADGVFVSGCRSGDCFYRFGNRWMAQRLHGERVPHLHARVERDRVHVFGAAETDKEAFLREITAFRERLQKIRQPSSEHISKQEEVNHG